MTTPSANERLAAQLAALNVHLALERDPTRRLVLRVALADVELSMAARIARTPHSEPLPRLLAQLARADITAATAGSAIARDPALAGQVAAVTLSGQFGDVSFGQVAGGNIVNVYIGDPTP